MKADTLHPHRQIRLRARMIQAAKKHALAGIDMFGALDGAEQHAESLGIPLPQAINSTIHSARAAFQNAVHVLDRILPPSTEAPSDTPL